MLLSIIENKLFCKKSWIFRTFSVLPAGFFSTNHFAPHCCVSVRLFGIWARSETTDVFSVHTVEMFMCRTYMFESYLFTSRPPSYSGNFRWNIPEICSISFFFPVGVVVTQFTDQYLDSFCFSSAIFSFRARENHRTHSRGTNNHNTKALSHLMKTVSTPSWVAVSLQQSAAGHFIPLAVSIFQITVFYKTFDIWLVFSLWVHEEEAALFNKLLHVMQTNWKYLITMLNTNKSVVLSTTSQFVFIYFDRTCTKKVLLETLNLSLNTFQSHLIRVWNVFWVLKFTVIFPPSSGRKYILQSSDTLLNTKLNTFLQNIARLKTNGDTGALNHLDAPK